LLGIVTTSVPVLFPLLNLKFGDDLNALSSASLSLRVSPSSPPDHTSTSVVADLAGSAPSIRQVKAAMEAAISNNHSRDLIGMLFFPFSENRGQSPKVSANQPRRISENVIITIKP
jgi:hypothetical protein